MGFSQISPDRLEAFLNAFQLNFKNQKPDEFVLLMGGYSSSQTYKMRIQKQNYAVRIMGLDQHLQDRQIQIECLAIAGANQIAPKCYYADAEAGIVITDFIESYPINVTRDWLLDIANCLKKLHAIDNFPRAYLDLFDYMKSLEDKLKIYPIAKALITYFQKIEEIKKLLKPHLIQISCHGDLNGNNILYDGKKNYLIDWEAGGLGDPYFDIVMICNQMIFCEEKEEYFLQQYFNGPLTEFQKAKLFMMKQISHCYCLLHFFVFAAEAGVYFVDEKLLQTLPSLKKWEQDYLSKKVSLDNPQDFFIYAAVVLKAALEQMPEQKFEYHKNKLV